MKNCSFWIKCSFWFFFHSNNKRLQLYEVLCFITQLKAHFVQQGCFFFQCSLATSKNWFVIWSIILWSGIHQDNDNCLSELPNVSSAFKVLLLVVMSRRLNFNQGRQSLKKARRAAIGPYLVFSSIQFMNLW